LASLSDLVSSGRIGARHVDVAMRARQLMERYSEIDSDFSLFAASHEKESDPDVVRAHRLLGYLRQPFLVAEPFTGRSGECRWW